LNLDRKIEINEMKGIPRLAAEMILTAIRDVVRPTAKPKYKASGRMYIRSDSEISPLSFLNSCYILGWNPDYIREQVAEYLE